MDDFDALISARQPTIERPLTGLTVLVVEDSRFACEAMRLLCLRSGARIRRADCLASARRHLQVYRPSVVIVDVGLPDGSGTELIEELHAATPRVGVILGTSGDDNARSLAMDAGADGFLAKPIESLAAFQMKVLDLLPGREGPGEPYVLPEATIVPDKIAFRDDLAHIADVLTTGADAHTLDYIAQFLSGVAKSAHDQPLEDAAGSLARNRARDEAGNGASPHSDDRVTTSVARLSEIVQNRLARGQAI